MNTETIAVTWGGAEVRVEMRQEFKRLRTGDVAGVKLMRTTEIFQREWYAVVLPVPEPINQGEGREIGASGATAQEALDALAVKLREVRDWADGVLRAPKVMS